MSRFFALLSPFVASMLFVCTQPPSANTRAEAGFLQLPSFEDHPKAGVWTDWQSCSCYHKLQYRARYQKPSFGDRHIWDIQFRNQYEKQANFSWELYKQQRPAMESTYRTRLNPGDSSQIQTKYVPCDEQLYVFVDKMRMGDDRHKAPYVNCDR
jgi:hypothetical protein